MCRSALTFAERFKIMQTKITKTIRVSIDVKQHLDEMKGSVSASEFIETMLSYFERNGGGSPNVNQREVQDTGTSGNRTDHQNHPCHRKDKIDKLLLHRKRTVMIC